MPRSRPRFAQRRSPMRARLRSGCPAGTSWFQPVVESAIRNRYFRESVDLNKRLVYARLKLHQEVQVAVSWVVPGSSGRAEQLQAHNAMAPAQVGDGGGVRGDFKAHGGCSCGHNSASRVRDQSAPNWRGGTRPGGAHHPRAHALTPYPLPSSAAISAGRGASASR